MIDNVSAYMKFAIDLIDILNVIISYRKKEEIKMFRTKRDIKMIKKVEELLTKLSREKVEMTGTTEKGITFQNDMYSNFVVF